MRSLNIDAIFLFAQFHMRAPIAIARMFLRNRTQLLNQMLVLHPALRASTIGMTGATDVRQRATATERHFVLAQVLDHLTPLLRAYHFFASTSFMASTSRSHSARSRLRRAFSCSRSRSRFTAVTSAPPYFWRHLSKGALRNPMRATNVANGRLAFFSLAQDRDNLCFGKRTVLHRIVLGIGRFYPIKQTSFVGACQVRSETWSTTPLAISQQRSWLRMWAEEAQHGTPPQRRPWARPEWFAPMEQWIADQLQHVGLARNGPVAQVRTWERSCVLRVSTTSGDVYTKAVPAMFAHEPRFARVLAALQPAHVLAPLQYAVTHHQRILPQMEACWEMHNMLPLYLQLAVARLQASGRVQSPSYAT
jgi:hypothetical protein